MHAHQAGRGRQQQQVNHHWDSRYFVVKTSISHRNGWTFVKLAVEGGFWALPPPRDTHRDLAAVFNEAFLAPRRSGADIYVFVKSYSTEQFLGYMRMTTRVGSPVLPRGEENAFGCIYECQLQVPFSAVRHLRNPYYRHSPSVTNSHDGEELPPDVGRELCRILQTQGEPFDYEATGPGSQQSHEDGSHYDANMLYNDTRSRGSGSEEQHSGRGSRGYGRYRTTHDVAARDWQGNDANGGRRGYDQDARRTASPVRRSWPPPDNGTDTHRMAPATRRQSPPARRWQDEGRHASSSIHEQDISSSFRNFAAARSPSPARRAAAYDAPSSSRRREVAPPPGYTPTVTRPARRGHGDADWPSMGNVAPPRGFSPDRHADERQEQPQRRRAPLPAPRMADASASSTAADRTAALRSSQAAALQDTVKVSLQEVSVGNVDSSKLDALAAALAERIGKLLPASSTQAEQQVRSDEQHPQPEPPKQQQQSALPQADEGQQQQQQQHEARHQDTEHASPAVAAVAQVATSQSPKAAAFQPAQTAAAGGSEDAEPASPLSTAPAPADAAPPPALQVPTQDRPSSAAPTPAMARAGASAAQIAIEDASLPPSPYAAARPVDLEPHDSTWTASQRRRAVELAAEEGVHVVGPDDLAPVPPGICEYALLHGHTAGACSPPELSGRSLAAAPFYYYIDPYGNIQGPASALSMAAWVHARHMLGSTKVFRCEPHLGRPMAAWKPKRSDFVMLDVLARQAMAAFDAEERGRAWSRVADTAAVVPAARLAAAEEALAEDAAAAGSGRGAPTADQAVAMAAAATAAVATDMPAQRAAGVLEPAFTDSAAAPGPVDERAGTIPDQQPSPPEVPAAKHDEESTDEQPSQAGEQQQDRAEQPVVGHQSTINTPAPSPASGTALMGVQPVPAGDEATGARTHTTGEAEDQASSRSPRVRGWETEGGLEQAPALSASDPVADGPEDAPGLSDARAEYDIGEGTTARVVVHVGEHDGRVQVKVQEM